MSELEDRIGSILSSPEEMEKIMQMARSLSGSLGGETPPTGEQEQTSAAPLGGLDPKIIGTLTRIMSRANAPGDDKTALLEAMKPYLRQERRSAIDRAAQMVRLSHIAKLAITELSGGEESAR